MHGSRTPLLRRAQKKKRIGAVHLVSCPFSPRDAASRLSSPAARAAAERARADAGRAASLWRHGHAHWRLANDCVGACTARPQRRGVRGPRRLPSCVTFRSDRRRGSPGFLWRSRSHFQVPLTQDKGEEVLPGVQELKAHELRCDAGRRGNGGGCSGPSRARLGWPHSRCLPLPVAVNLHGTFLLCSTMLQNSCQKQVRDCGTMPRASAKPQTAHSAISSPARA